jgi:hypothetical protein
VRYDDESDSIRFDWEMVLSCLVLVLVNAEDCDRALEILCCES